LFDKSENASNVSMAPCIQRNYAKSADIKYGDAATLSNPLAGGCTCRRGWNRSHGLAESIWMLRAVPCKGRILALFRHDFAISTPVARVPYLLIAAVDAVDKMAFFIALLRAEHISVLVINHSAVIEVDVARIAECGRVVSSAFGFAIPVGAMYVVSVAHRHVPPTMRSHSLERTRPAEAT
jgi:hypothetical protein